MSKTRSLTQFKVDLGLGPSENLEYCTYCGCVHCTAEIEEYGGYCPCCNRQENFEQFNPTKHEPVNV